MILKDMKDFKYAGNDIQKIMYKENILWQRSNYNGNLKPNEWTQLNSLPTNYSKICVYNDELHLFNYTNGHYKYDITNDTWLKIDDGYKVDGYYRDIKGVTSDNNDIYIFYTYIKKDSLYIKWNPSDGYHDLIYKNISTKRGESHQTKDIYFSYNNDIYLKHCEAPISYDQSTQRNYCNESDQIRQIIKMNKDTKLIEINELCTTIPYFMEQDGCFSKYDNKFHLISGQQKMLRSNNTYSFYLFTNGNDTVNMSWDPKNSTWAYHKPVTKSNGLGDERLLIAYKNRIHMINYLGNHSAYNIDTDEYINYGTLPFELASNYDNYCGCEFNNELHVFNDGCHYATYIE